VTSECEPHAGWRARRRSGGRGSQAKRKFLRWVSRLAWAFVPGLPLEPRTINRGAFVGDCRKDADVWKPTHRGSVHVDHIVFVVIGVAVIHTRPVVIVARMVVIVRVVDVRVIDVEA
jgi:hypothetical protein